MGHKRKIAVIGLGYVGLNIACAFGKKANVIGFDIDATRIAELNAGIDKNKQFSEAELKETAIEYTADADTLEDANFYIIAVPTLLKATNHPDLTKLLDATEVVAKQLKKGDVVVFESTVYPGVTEEDCIPILEKYSKLRCQADFGVGYSPERVNLGDTAHTFETIVKIISAVDNQTLDLMENVYNEVLQAGTYRAASIKVAEAAKLIENTQRNINIAFMNETAEILHHCNIDMKDVLAAAGTKWNFAPYRPGLVGGHCINNSAYYLAHKAMHVGCIPHFIFAALDVNKNMPNYLAQIVSHNFEQLKVPIKNARVAVLGITYKANSGNFHDSKVKQLIDKLISLGMNVVAHDPLADKKLVSEQFGLELISWDELHALDAIIIAVNHNEYCQLDAKKLETMLNPKGIVMDVMGAIEASVHLPPTIRLWKL